MLKTGSTARLRNLISFFLVIISACPAAAAQTSFPSYDLFVSFDTAKNLIMGTAEISLDKEGITEISTGGLRIISVSLNGIPRDFRRGEGRLGVSGKGTLKIVYEGVFKGPEGGGSLENPGVVSGGIISDRGISLTGGWYPSLGSLAAYRLTAVVPSRFAAVSEADEISYRETPSGREYSFAFPHPVGGIDFIAGDYRVAKEKINGIDVYTYFFPEDEDLAADYLEHCAGYFRLYEGLLTPYPYKRFSVVENILPTGYSMPTFTLLGREVIRLPFIPGTSLGHEITHQWFGNYVYADLAKGNWLEGITTYLSDHLYEERAGRGWEYRKKILVDYRSYVTPQKDFPLREFRGRTDFASRAIGYGKGAMLFHMLKNLTDEKTFYGALKRFIGDNAFRPASWADIERAFEEASGKDLRWFFAQWLDRKGLPSFAAEDGEALFYGGAPSASFRFEQQGEAYEYTLPVTVSASRGEKRYSLAVKREKQYEDIPVGSEPLGIIFDENYDVMRFLTQEEFAPAISRLLGAEEKLVVYRKDDRDKYSVLIDLLRKEGFAAKEEEEMKDGDLSKPSLLVLGSESPVLRRLFAKIPESEKGFIITVRNNPLDPAKVLAYAEAGSKEEVDLAASKLFHYGAYSELLFDKGRNVRKEIAPSDRGVRVDLTRTVQSVEPQKTLEIPAIIEKVQKEPAIIVGERHDHYGDHRVELSVITGLYERGRKFAIGMEMFQTPYQNILDDFVAGVIDEKTFLRRSEYFKRWKFDYNLYREILEFARAKRIPVVALNQRSEIVDKVASGGLGALSEEEMKDIPPDMDMSDEAYRQRLKNIFEGHPAGGGFDNFYAAQILWDETMAHTASAFLKERPDYQMVLLAGEGHVVYRSGIPDRLKRLTGRDCITIINGALDESIGDYVVFHEDVQPPFSARLGVLLEQDGERVLIKGFSDDSLARKAGLREKDAITRVGDEEIRTVEDVKIALYDKKPYETVKVQVMRKAFFGMEKGYEYSITF